MAEPCCSVVIAAGGLGTRMEGGPPKQFRLLLGLPLLLWPVRFFRQFPEVGEIVVAAPRDSLDAVQELCRSHLPDTSIVTVSGGQRRQDSVYAGLGVSHSQFPLVAVHDAARPFPPANFADALSAAQEHGAAIFAVPVSDTLKRAEHGAVRNTLPRHALWGAQTPQIFRRELLKTALEHCSKDGITVTDDAEAVEKLGGTVRIVPGCCTNIKVTCRADWMLAEAIARLRAR